MLAASPGLDDDSLSTRRLTLTRPSVGDVMAIAALAHNPTVATNTSRIPFPYRPGDALAWIERTSAATGPAAAYVIRLGDADGTIIGAAAYHPHEVEEGVEIGFWIGEPYWGRGYATEAAHAVVDAAFGRHRLEEVWAACRPTNEASRRVIVKCGFQWIGTGLRRSLALNGMVSVERYRLDRKCWKALKSWSSSSAAGAAERGEGQDVPARNDGRR